MQDDNKNKKKKNVAGPIDSKTPFGIPVLAKIMRLVNV